MHNPPILERCVSSAARTSRLFAFSSHPVAVTLPFASSRLLRGHGRGCFLGRRCIAKWIPLLPLPLLSHLPQSLIQVEGGGRTPPPRARTPPWIRPLDTDTCTEGEPQSILRFMINERLLVYQSQPAHSSSSVWLRRPHSAPFGSAPFGRGGILEEEDIDEGGEEDYDNGKGDQADRPPLVAKRRVAARRRAPATAAAAVGAAAPRAHRVPSSSSRAAPAARQASYSSAPRAPRATRGLQGPSRDGVTSTASGPARPSTAAPAYPAGARGASPYSTRAWLPPPSAANPLHHPAPLAGFGATEGGSMGEGEGQQTSVRARGTARPGLKGRAISGRAPLPSSAVPSGESAHHPPLRHFAP